MNTQQNKTSSSQKWSSTKGWKQTAQESHPEAHRKAWINRGWK